MISRNFTTVWGAPVPCIQTRKQGKVAVSRHASGSGKQGGVGLVATKSCPLVPTSRDVRATDLFRRTRWVRAAVPLTSKTTTAKRWLHIISFYNISGHDQGLIKTQRNRLLEKVFTDAAQFGDQPVLICTDANTRIDKCVSLSLALASGRWVDLASHFAHGDPQPTFCSSKLWDKASWTQNASRPDYIFANKAALSLCVDFKLRRDLSPPGHLGLQVTLNLSLAVQTTRQVVFPKAFPIYEAITLSETDKEALAETHIQRYKSEFEQARQSDPNVSWAIFAKTAEAYLQDRCAKTSVQGQGGRHRQVRFTERPVIVLCADKTKPEATATHTLKQYHKTLRRLREMLWKKNKRSPSPQDLIDIHKLSSSIKAFLHRYAKDLSLPKH